jgi:hypothetical protein
VGEPVRAAMEKETKLPNGHRMGFQPFSQVVAPVQPIPQRIAAETGKSDYVLQSRSVQSAAHNIRDMGSAGSI